MIALMVVAIGTKGADFGFEPTVIAPPETMFKSLAAQASCKLCMTVAQAMCRLRAGN